MRGAGAGVHFQSYGGEPSLPDCIAAHRAREVGRIGAADRRVDEPGRLSVGLHGGSTTTRVTPCTWHRWPWSPGGPPFSERQFSWRMRSHRSSLSPCSYGCTKSRGCGSSPEVPYRASGTGPPIEPTVSLSIWRCGGGSARSRSQPPTVPWRFGDQGEQTCTDPVLRTGSDQSLKVSESARPFVVATLKGGLVMNHSALRQ